MWLWWEEAGACVAAECTGSTCALQNAHTHTHTQVVGNQLVTGLNVEEIEGVPQVTQVEATDRQTGELLLRVFARGDCVRCYGQLNTDVGRRTARSEKGEECT